MNAVVTAAVAVALAAPSGRGLRFLIIFAPE
jgi:hypothetical protein